VIEAVVVELENDVVGECGLDDAIEVQRELVFVTGVRHLVHERVRHGTQQSLGVLVAIELVEAGKRMEADGDEVELLDDDIGQVDPVLGISREVRLAALENADAVEHTRNRLHVPEVPRVRALRHRGTVIGDGDEFDARSGRCQGVLGDGGVGVA